MLRCACCVCACVCVLRRCTRMSLLLTIIAPRARVETNYDIYFIKLILAIAHHAAWSDTRTQPGRHNDVRVYSSAVAAQPPPTLCTESGLSDPDSAIAPQVLSIACHRLELTARCHPDSAMLSSLLQLEILHTKTHC